MIFLLFNFCINIRSLHKLHLWKIMNTKGNDSGLKYRWPRNTDQLWAKEGDIVCIVPEPVAT